MNQYTDNFNFGDDIKVNIGMNEIKQAKNRSKTVIHPKKEYVFYGNLKLRLHVVLIKNYFEIKYADKMFEGLRQIKYNTDEDSMIKIVGKNIKIPRKQTAFGEYGSKYHFSGINVDARDWTIKDDTIDSKMGNELKQICNIVGKTSGCKFNYVLINNYFNQTNYIGYHSDDERELGMFPVIAGLSLGQSREMYFKSKLTGNVIKILLPHNSLVIMHYPTNCFWKHCIPKSNSPIGQRISLTFRSVDKMKRI